MKRQTHIIVPQSALHLLHGKDYIVEYKVGPTVAPWHFALPSRANT